MVVWLKLKIRSKIKNNEVIVNGLVNSGYETESPEILVDSKIAKELGYYPKFPKETSIETYTMAGSTEIKLIHIKNAVTVQVLTEDRPSSEVSSDLVISEKESDVLISDKLASKLSIVLLDIGGGIWCFKDEIGKKARKSAT